MVRDRSRSARSFRPCLRHDARSVRVLPTEWDVAQPQIGTIVAIEGGPGYATTDSRDYYLELFAADAGPARAAARRPARHGAVRAASSARRRRSYDGNWVANAEACGAQLGQPADLYTSAGRCGTTSKVVSTRSASRRSTSTATATARSSPQTFAVRYPQRSCGRSCSTPTYPIEGLDPLVPDERDAAAREPRTLLRAQPAHVPHHARRHGRTRRSRAQGADPREPAHDDRPGRRPGRRRTVDPHAAQGARRAAVHATATPGCDARVTSPPWRRCSPATRGRSGAWSAEVADRSGRLQRVRRPGRPRPQSCDRSYSEGAYLAYACSDYPAALERERVVPGAAENQFAAARGRPGAAAHVSPVDEQRSGRTPSSSPTTTACTGRSRASLDPPFPAGGRYPYDADARPERRPRPAHRRVPGARGVRELPPEQLRRGAERRPRHGALRRRRVRGRRSRGTFVETRATGGTEVPGAHPRASDRAALRRGRRGRTAGGRSPRAPTARRPADRRASRVAVEALADVIDRWYAIPGLRAAPASTAASSR